VVRGPDGGPIPEARVFFSSTPVAVPDVAVLTDDRGEFALTAPVPGAFGIEVAADGFTSDGAIVDVSESGDAEVEFRLSLE
jgi:hypothetical protein